MISEDERVRISFGFIFFALAVAASYPLLSVFIHSQFVTDDQLRTSFVGQAAEDIFGFGFWFMWVPLAVVEAVMLLVAWLLRKARACRVTILVTLGLFVAASVLCYVAYVHEFKVWRGVT